MRLLLAIVLGFGGVASAEDAAAPDAALSAERRVPVLFQGSLPACLPYAAASAAQHQGWAVEPLALTRQLAVTPAGIAWVDVEAALLADGLPARLVRLDADGLRAALADGPVVVAQAGASRGHAMVVERAFEAHYVVMDPANPGAETLPATQVEAALAAAGGQALVIATRSGP